MESIKDTAYAMIKKLSQEGNYDYTPYTVK